MKKILLLIVVVMNLFSYVYRINEGWNLIGVHSNIDVKNLGNNYKILWVYKNGKWYAYSPDDDLLELIKNKFDIVDEINNTQGVWIFSENNFSFVSDFIDNEKIQYYQGWQLVSLPKEGNVSFELFNNSDIQYVWKYVNNEWYGYSSDEKINELILQKYNLLYDINDNEGFWINAKKDGQIFIGKNYYAYFYFVDDNKLLPFKYQMVRDNFNNVVGYTDSNGKIYVNTPKTLLLSDEYNYLPIVMNASNYNYITFVSKKDINQTEIYSDVFDIGNFRLGDVLTLIEAKIPPKVFLSLDKKYGILIRKFTTNEDITIAVIPEVESNESVLGAMQIKLEDSLGNEISQEEAGFSGEFQIYINSEKQENDVVIMQKNGDEIKYVSDTYYLNGKYYSKKNLTTLGEFLFVKIPKLYIHKLFFTNVNKAIVIDSNLNSYIINKEGEFKSINKEENITIFADDFKSVVTSVEDEKNITLEPKTYINKCLVFKNLLTNELIKNINLEAKYGNEIIKLKINDNAEACFITENNLSEILIDDINYTIVNNIVYYLPQYLNFVSNAVSYSDLSEYNFTYFIYNTTSGSYIYNLDENKTIKLGNYVFNSVNQNIIADIADNIYKITQDGIEKSNFSKEDFFVDIGNFVFSPIKSKDYFFFPTTTGKIIITDLNGNNIGASPISLKTYDTNKTNDIVMLYDINNSYAYAIVNEGLVYLINKYTKNAELITQTDALNYYSIAFDGDLYIASDKIYKISGKDISEFMNIKAERICKIDKYFIIDNKVFIDGEYAYSFDGVLVKAFELNDSLMIITENAIYKNNEKRLTFNKKIVNSDLKNGYFLIELENGNIIIFK